MKFTAAFVALVAFCCGPCFAAAPPHIVYFLVDDLGYADCGFNGGPLPGAEKE